MISPKTLIKMARKWQRLATIRRRRISFPGNLLSVADKGHFVVYTTDQKRYVFPWRIIFQELLKMSEEEIGLPRDVPISLPCEAVCMDCVISLISNHTIQDREKAILCPLLAGVHTLSINRKSTRDYYNMSTLRVSWGKNKGTKQKTLIWMAPFELRPNMSLTAWQIEEIYGPQCNVAP
ncbi:hypothetical protein RJ639_024241 [Escallonia herrerae]|uniref:Uncharacterized protein n=1 Tax=Escallonia herrerae TaxID=1293975 RepID=A0AA89AEM4_9ASTE|nr:hypothetical protein RJ639_024241 [Escallonia herrerae]